MPKPTPTEEECKNISTVHRKANITVPVTLKPNVVTKDAVTFCCGEPELKKRPCNCENCRKGHCSFVLSQNICIEIPIEFSTETILDKPCIRCEVLD